MQENFYFLMLFLQTYNEISNIFLMLLCRKERGGTIGHIECIPNELIIEAMSTLFLQNFLVKLSEIVPINAALLLAHLFLIRWN